MIDKTHAEMSTHRWSAELKRVDVDGAGYGRAGKVNYENVPPVALEKSRMDAHQDNDKYLLPDINVLRNRFLQGYQTGSGENTTLPFQAKDKGLHLSNTKIVTANTNARNVSSVGGRSTGLNDGVQFDLDYDPETFFEVTSHAERYKYTRAKFAELEKQYLREQECHHLAFKKKAVRGMSLPLKMTLSTIDGTDFAAAKSPTKTSLQQQRPEGLLYNSKGSMSGARTATLNSDFRGHSPSRGTRSPSLEKPVVSAGAHVARSIHTSDRSAPMVKAERVVSVGDGPISDDRGVVSEEVPDPKWLMKHFEEVSRSSGASDLRKVVPQKRQPTTDKHHFGNHSPQSKTGDISLASLITTSHRNASSPRPASLGSSGIAITKTGNDSVSEWPAWRQQDSLKRDENSATAPSSLKSGFSGISRPYSSSNISSGKGSSGSRTNDPEVELRKKRWEYHDANRKSFDEVEGETVAATIEAWKSKRRSFNSRDSLHGLEDPGKSSTTVVESDALLLLQKQGSTDSSLEGNRHSNRLEITLPSKTFEAKMVVDHDEKVSTSPKSSASENDEPGRKHGFMMSQNSLKSPAEARSSFDFGSPDRTSSRSDVFMKSQGSLKSPATEARSSFDLGSPDRSGSRSDVFLKSQSSVKSPTAEARSSFDLGSPDRTGSRNFLMEIGSKAATVGLVASSVSKETAPSNNLETLEKTRSRLSSSEDEGEKIAKDEKITFNAQPRDSVATNRFVSLLK